LDFQDPLSRARGALGGGEMQVIIVIVCLGLLIWLEPARAQQAKTHLLTVGHHKNVEISDNDVKKILAEASKALEKCKVVLKLKGSVGTFASTDTPAAVKNAATRDAVHRENFDVKIVEHMLDFCRVEALQAGCAWDPPPGKERPQYRSIIVANMSDAKLAGKIWAHEFGHMTGLPHRGDKNALMACRVEHAQISKDECDCFRGGPAACAREPEPAGQCPIQ
jgi:hypothetical protein